MEQEQQGVTSSVWRGGAVEGGKSVGRSRCPLLSLASGQFDGRGHLVRARLRVSSAYRSTTTWQCLYMRLSRWAMRKYTSIISCLALELAQCAWRPEAGSLDLSRAGGMSTTCVLH